MNEKVDRDKITRREKDGSLIEEGIKRNLDNMLSYGSNNLGLNRVERDNTAKERLEEDIKI